MEEESLPGSCVLGSPGKFLPQGWGKAGAGYGWISQQYQLAQNVLEPRDFQKQFMI